MNAHKIQENSILAQSKDVYLHFNRSGVALRRSVAFKLLLSILFFSLISACGPVVTPLSHEVRSGGTVAIQVQLEVQDFLEHEDVGDLKVYIRDANSVDHEASIRGVFKLYPDAVSEFGTYGQEGAPYGFNTPAYGEGAWVAIIDMLDVSGNPLPLAVGAATMRIKRFDINNTATHSFDPASGRIGGNNNGNDHPLVVLSGTAPSTPAYADFLSRSFERLEALPHVYVNVTGTPPIGKVVAGIEFEVEYDAAQLIAGSNYTALYDSGARSELTPVRTASVGRPGSLVWSVSDSAPAGNKVLKVLYSNAQGFHEVGSFAGNFAVGAGQLAIRDLNKLALVWQYAGGATAVSDFTVLNPAVYDTDGELIPGMSIELVEGIL